MAQVLADAAERRPAKMIRVWDVFVRLFHWSVAVGFFIAYFTEDGPLTVHVWAGYAVGSLVVVRIVWASSGLSTPGSQVSFIRRERCSAIFGICSSGAQNATSGIARAVALWCCSF
jgi:hypothetical protein